MIQITSVQNSLGVNNALSIDFILFNKIVCSCVFEDKGFKDWGEIKVYIENQLKEDFKNVKQPYINPNFEIKFTPTIEDVSKQIEKQLEGRPSNLKTK